MASASLNDVFISIRQSLIGSVLRIVHERQIAEDIAQETYLRAHRASERGPVDHWEAYLHQTARNLAIDHRRRAGAIGTVMVSDRQEAETGNVAADSPSPEESLIQRERLELLAEALKRLPPRVQTVWRLNRIEKWTYPQIAAHLGVSPNTVYNDMKMALGHCLDALSRLDRT
jgi:RNA polymerase sigma factor (sigma-70 family)